VHTVGVIVNPIAGKDIRRLATAASHTSDSSKIETVRRAVIAAVEAGADRVMVSGDPHRLAERAVHGLDLPVDLLDIELRRDRSDTSDAAAAMWKRGVDAVVVLGGDGTCRDVAKGWPDATIIPISTGTNNVYPMAIDATSAGTAVDSPAASGQRPGRGKQFGATVASSTCNAPAAAHYTRAASRTGQDSTLGCTGGAAGWAGR